MSWVIVPSWYARSRVLSLGALSFFGQASLAVTYLGQAFAQERTPYLVLRSARSPTLSEVWYTCPMATTTAEGEKKPALTNEEIGRRLGLAHSTVSRMRRGQRITSPSVMARMRKEFGVSPDAMLGAAAQAAEGDTGPWVELMSETFGPLAE